MAQGLFVTEEIIEQRKHDALVQRGMSLWAQKAEDYRVLPFKYLFLLGLLKERRLKLKKLPKNRLDDYPDVPLFNIFEKAEAEAWLEEKDIPDLERELEHIDFLLKTSYTYTSLKSWLVDAVYRLENKRPSAFSLAR